MRIEVTIIGFLLIIFGIGLFFYDSIRVGGSVVYPYGNAGLTVILIGAITVLVSYFIIGKEQRLQDKFITVKPEPELKNEYYPILYKGGHPDFKSKVMVRLKVTPDYVLVERKGELESINIEIPITPTMNINVERNNFSIEYTDKDDSKKILHFEAYDSAIQKIPDLIELIKEYIEKSASVDLPKQEQIKEVENTDLNEPLKILKTRFARGEITKEEYEEMKKTLKS